MAPSLLPFALQDGFVDHWLTAGPVAVPLEGHPAFLDPKTKKQIAERFHDPKSGVTRMPVEPGPLVEAKFSVGKLETEWGYFHCSSDHLIDHSVSFLAPHFVRTWAYAQITSPVAQKGAFVLTAAGPADVWVNDQPTFQVADSPDSPSHFSFEADLKEGTNEVVVRLSGVAAPDCLLVMALHVQAQGAAVAIPTLIPSVERRQELESVADQVWLDRDVYTADDQVRLHWPPDLEKAAFNDVRFQTASGRIYAQAEDVGNPGQALFLGNPVGLSEGPYNALIMPRAWELYESEIRVTRYLPAWLTGPNRFSSTLYGSVPDRKREALVYAMRHEGELFAEVARMALGRWGDVQAQNIRKAIEAVDANRLNALEQLLGLLGAVARFGSQPEFPRWIKKEIKACALRFAFSAENVVGDSSQTSPETSVLLLFACKVLAGQLYPDGEFTATGESGKILRKTGEGQAMAWMQAHGKWGFAGWDSPQLYADTLMALSYLVDFARHEALWELGSVLMDKMFLSLALNSFKGCFASTRGRSTTLEVKSAYLEATSGITRLFWGLGVYNQHIAPLVSLACQRKYELPLILAEIAVGQQEELLNKEQHGAGDVRVNKVTYRTPDTMLASAQDYRPGQPGKREHIWQATLGPQSPVFVNHPGSMSQNDVHVPNFWLGNGALPRVAQWKDALIALYRLPADARLDFTHAYFPTATFDEYVIRDGMAFARKGDGYLALTAAQGLRLIDRGRTAFRELRSGGRENIWVCQMGRAALDGDFAAFQEKVLASRPQFDGLAIDWQTIRGDALQFGWQSPLRVNGNEQPLSGFKHFDNPYTQADLPCQEMEVRTEHYLLRLDFQET